MDILGIMIGFASIMLLFSLLVSALVHGAQATLNLRLRNMKGIIGAFFKHCDQVDDDIQQLLNDKLAQRTPNQVYSTVLPVNILGNRLELTRVSKKELIDMVYSITDMASDAKECLKEKIEKEFGTLEEIMIQRFKQWMHQISIGLAFIICFVFQLNCFELLNKLNHDSAYRQQAIQVVQALPTDTQYFEKSIRDDTLQGGLSALNFTINPDNWKSYYATPAMSSLTHWLGIIFSAILISLGAPFWFNRLKDMASLRDKLSKQPS